MIGTPIPCQRRGEEFKLRMPQSWPHWLTIGPPSEPGLTAAEVSMAGPW